MLSHSVTEKVEAHDDQCWIVARAAVRVVLPLRGDFRQKQQSDRHALGATPVSDRDGPGGGVNAAA